MYVYVEMDKIKAAILAFPWWHYGLDEVTDATSDEYADHLTQAIASAGFASPATIYAVEGNESARGQAQLGEHQQGL